MNKIKLNKSRNVPTYKPIKLNRIYILQNVPIEKKINPEQKQELFQVPVFIDIPIASNRINEKSIYADIINRSRDPYLTSSRPTNAHETTHDLNSMIRNSRRNSNGLYVLNGKGIVIENPNIRKSVVAQYIPVSLREYRFKTYITGSPDWDDTPTYILDEFVAYMNGSAVAVEDKKSGKAVGQVDEMSGTIEFSFYSIALAMAVEKHDPSYWNSNEQFRISMNWLLKRAKDIFDSGKDIPEYSSRVHQLEQTIKNSPDAEEMRVFIRKHFNGIWLN